MGSGCMTQILRGRLNDVSAQRDRQKADVRRLQDELYRAKAKAATDNNALWDAYKDACDEITRLNTELDNAHANSLREQPF